MCAQMVDKENHHLINQLDSPSTNNFIQKQGLNAETKQAETVARLTWIVTIFSCSI